MISTWILRGAPHGHTEFSARLFADPDVKAFRV
jgi:hypothetical protein